MRLRQDVLALNGFFLSFVGMGLTSACLGPTLPSLAATTGTSLAQVGLLAFSRALGGIIGSYFAGPALDRGHGRVTLVLSMLLMTISLILVPLSHSLLALVGIFLLLGAGQGALNSGGNTLLLWKHPKRAHSLISALHFCYGVGAVLAPLMVAWFLPVRSDGLFVYWVFAIAILPVAATFVFSKAVSVEAPQEQENTTTDRQLSWPLVWGIALFFLYVGAEATAGTWLFAFAEQAAHFTPTNAAYLVATFWGSFTAGRLLTIVGSAYITPQKFVLGSMAAATIACLGILLLPQDGIWLWICAAALGLSMAAVFPQAFSFVMSSIGVTGRRAGWLLIAGSVGGMLVPWLAGHMLEAVSAQTLPILVAICTSLAVLAFLMVRRTANQGANPIPMS